MRMHREDADQHVVPEPLHALNRTLEAVFRDPDRERAELAAIRAALTDDADTTDASTVIPITRGGHRPTRRIVPVGWVAEPVERARAAVASLVARLPGTGSVTALGQPDVIRRWMTVAAACIAIFFGVVVFTVGLFSSDPSGSGAVAGGSDGRAEDPIPPGSGMPNWDTSDPGAAGLAPGTVTTSPGKQFPRRGRPPTVSRQPSPGSPPGAPQLTTTTVPPEPGNPPATTAPSPPTSTVPPMYDVGIDAVAVSYSRLEITGVAWFETQQVHVFRLAPGNYVVEADMAALVNFSVNSVGHVEYDTSLDAVLSGRGGSTLVIRGLAITVDATTTHHSEFLLAGVGVFGSGRPHTVRLLPGAGQVSFVDWRSFEFMVSLSGFVDYDASLDEFLSGRGTSTLTIT